MAKGESKKPQPIHSMMTEELAKTKWCPMVRMVTGKIDQQSRASQHNGAQSSYNRVVDEALYAFPAGGGCIASHCMMWRNAEGDSGYCGLAGKP